METNYHRSQICTISVTSYVSLSFGTLTSTSNQTAAPTFAFSESSSKVPILRCLRIWPDGSESSLKPLLLNNVQLFASRFATATAGKAFLVTGSGYLGLGLDATQVGDYVCIIRGCALPVVILEYDDGDYFQVVGQCYAWAAMYGEFVESMHTRGLQWETLKFR